MHIEKDFTFDAAHYLPNHDGKCRNLHGHTYKVTVAIIGTPRARVGASDEGMVLDFGVLSDAFNSDVKDKLDHTLLNDRISLPTAENIALCIFGTLWHALTPGFEQRPTVQIPELSYVCVQETPTARALCYFNDWDAAQHPRIAAAPVPVRTETSAFGAFFPAPE